jgi:ribosomal-protein-alanine N-acetyltransferase
VEDVVIREATPDDVEPLLDVYEAVAAEGRWIGGELPIDRERMRRGWLERLEAGGESALTLVAEVDGRAIGQLDLWVSHGRAALGMAILEGYRGRGIGSALMERAIAWAGDRGLAKISLEVWPHNTRAIALYEKFGFRREGYHPQHWVRKNGEAWDLISMGLVLDAR